MSLEGICTPIYWAVWDLKRPRPPLPWGTLKGNPYDFCFEARIWRPWGLALKLTPSLRIIIDVIRRHIHFLRSDAPGAGHYGRPRGKVGGMICSSLLMWFAFGTMIIYLLNWFDQMLIGHSFPHQCIVQIVIWLYTGHTHLRYFELVVSGIYPRIFQRIIIVTD